MLFNSFEFIFAFLPITFIAYFGLNRLGHKELSKVTLVIASLYFYAFFNVSYLPIIIVSILVNYGLSYVMTYGLRVPTPHISTNYALLLESCLTSGCWGISNIPIFSLKISMLYLAAVICYVISYFPSESVSSHSNN